MNRSSKSPYKTLFSCAQNKINADTTRKVYLHDLPLKQGHYSKNKDDMYRKYHSSSRNIHRDLKVNLSKTKYGQNTTDLMSERRASKNKENSMSKLDSNTVRYSKFSKNKMYSSSSKLDRNNDKSTIITTLLSTHHQREQKLKEDKKKHEEGKNCRVIVIEGNEEMEHYIEVNNIGDILAQLKK